MANDRELSDAERVWIISRVINTKGLNGLLEEIAAEFKTTTIPGLARPLSDGKELPKPIFINNSEEQVTTISTPSKASIYRESAKDLVEQDRRDHPVVPEETEDRREQRHHRRTVRSSREISRHCQCRWRSRH